MAEIGRQDLQKKDKELWQVHCGPKVKTLFVVVPGLGTLTPDRWSDEQGDTWLRSIKPESASDAGIFAFHNELPSGNKEFSWTHVEAQGAEFLGALYRLVQVNELNDCPIILFSHSTGGFVLKRALCIAYHDPQRFRALLWHIAGVVFLSCPHSQADNVDAWKNVSTILRTFLKPKGPKYDVSRPMAKGFAQDCLVFEQAMERVPVLSLYEKAKTKTPGMFGQKMILVDKRLATTNVRNERCIGLEADHNSICCIQGGSKELDQVTDFIDSATNNTRKAIKKDSREYVRPIGLGQTTVRSRSDAGSVQKLSTGRDSSSLLHPTIPVTSMEGKEGSTAASFQMIPSLTDFSIEKANPKLPCHVIPLSHNRDFVGRKKILEALENVLVSFGEHSSVSDESDDDTHLRTFALCGPGGMGKTQIAAEFVHRNKAKFDAVLWIRADEPSKIARSFAHIAVALGLIEADSTDARDQVLARDAVLGWLANPLKTYKQLDDRPPEEASWLLVFDNVDNPDVLDDYWPADSSGSVLITSRDPLAKSYFYSHSDGTSLLPLDNSEATKLLLKLTGRRRLTASERNDATAVAEILGGLPLAITQMAGIIARRDWSFAEFLDLYQKESAHADLFGLQLGPSRTRAGYEHTIASVWALENLNDSSVLLDTLSVLDPDSIPEYILEDNPASKMWEGYPSDSAAYQQARTELLQSSLITRQQDTKRIIIHRLIQDAVRAKMSDEKFDLTFSSTLNLLSTVWPYEEFSFGNETYRWTRCEELSPHVLRLQKLFSRFHPPLQLSAFHLQGPKLLLDAAWNSIMHADYAETSQLLDMAESMCEALHSQSLESGGSSSLELKEQLRTLRRLSYHHRGVHALHTNRPQVSLAQLKIFTDMLREKYGDITTGGTDQSLGVGWNELGNAVLQNNDGKWAEECFLKSIESLSALDGATAITISMPLINLGFAYWMQGLLTDAAATFRRALEDREKEYGVDDKTSFVTGKLLLGYGNVKWDQGLLDESFSLHQRCLRQYKSSIGNNHHRTADGCVKVSDHYIRLHQYDSAITLLDQALKIYGDHEYFVPEAARTRFKRGKVFQVSGRSHEAGQDFEIALKLYREMCPHDLRTLAELKDEDYDKRIMFWSR